MAKDIEMNYKGQDGGYEVLYPENMSYGSYLGEALDLAFGFDRGTVQDALALLGGKHGYNCYVYKITLKDLEGNPVSGVKLLNLKEVEGSGYTTTTDENGVALGAWSESTYNFIISPPYIDWEDIRPNMVATNYYAEAEFTFSKRSGVINIAGSTSHSFSSLSDPIDIYAVGGGGSGGVNCGLTQRAVSGGGSGYITIAENVEVKGKTINITIGAKGSGVNTNNGSVKEGRSGGNTSISYYQGNTICTAKGGEGGKTGNVVQGDEDYGGCSGASGNSGSGCCAGAVINGRWQYAVTDGGSDGNSGEELPASLRNYFTPGQGEGKSCYPFGDVDSRFYIGGGGGGFLIAMASQKFSSQGGKGAGNGGDRTNSSQSGFDAPSKYNDYNCYGGGGGGVFTNIQNSYSGSGRPGFVCIRFNPSSTQ